MDLLTVNDPGEGYPGSSYAASNPAPAPLHAASGEITADVAVVGGGFTGLSAALHLAQAGQDVVLLEARRLGFGASGRNGGQVSLGQRQDQIALERWLGREDARALWDISVQAVALVRALAARPEVAVPFHPGIVHADHKPGLVRETHAHVEHLRHHYGHDGVQALSREALRAIVASPAYHGGMLDEGSGHLDPLAFALGLARLAQAAGARLHEDSRVRRIAHGARVTLHTDRAVVRADHVVLACNGYLGGLEPSVAARVMPINSFIVATEPLGAERAAALIAGNRAVTDSLFVVRYFRFSEETRLLFGGLETYTYRFPRDIAGKGRRKLAGVFPDLAGVAIDHAWGGTLAITRTRMPHVARVRGNLLSFSGYSGHGVALATLAGRIAAEAIGGQAGRFDVMARVPTPPFPGGAALRGPLLALAMAWFALRDRL